MTAVELRIYRNSLFGIPSGEFNIHTVSVFERQIGDVQYSIAELIDIRNNCLQFLILLYRNNGRRLR